MFDRIGHDPVREIAALGGFQAGAGADDAGKVGAGSRGSSEHSLDGASEIRGSHQRARRVADARTKLERVRPATVGRGRDRECEVGYEARAVGATATPIARQPVVREQNAPKAVAVRGRSRGSLLSNYDQRAATERGLTRVRRRKWAAVGATPSGRLPIGTVWTTPFRVGSIRESVPPSRLTHTVLLETATLLGPSPTETFARRRSRPDRFGDRAVERVCDPHRARTDSDRRRPAADVDGLDHAPCTGIDPGDAALRLARHPDRPVTDRDRVCTCVNCDRRTGRAGARVDPHHRPVGGVRDPDGPSPNATPLGSFPTCIVSTTPPHTGRSSTPSRPDCSRPRRSHRDRDPGRPVADRNRLLRRVCRRIDSRDRVAVRVRHPHRPHAAPRSGSHRPRSSDDTAGRRSITPTAFASHARASTGPPEPPPSANTGIATAPRPPSRRPLRRAANGAAGRGGDFTGSRPAAAGTPPGAPRRRAVRSAPDGRCP